MRAVSCALALAAAALPGPARADWSCRIEAYCPAGDACRPAADPVPVSVRQTAEGWMMAAEGQPPDLLRALSAPGAVPFMAVSLEGGETVTALAIEAGGAWHAAVLDLSLGEALALVVRGTCTED